MILKRTFTVFLIELDLQIEQFYDNETFDLFYQGIMKIENKESLKKHSKIELEKVTEFPSKTITSKINDSIIGQSKFKFSYEGKTKLKTLDNNFNDFKKNIELDLQIEQFYDNETFDLFYQGIMKIENKESLKKYSKIELEKVTEFPTKIKSPKKEIIDSFISQQKFKFSYEGKIKQKTLDNNFNDFNKNIHSLLDLSEDEKFIFKIQKELNLQISQFYDNETFKLFYQGIMNLENKELLKKHSKIELKKALELSFSYKENTKLKILDNNFNRFKKNIYKIFEIQDTDLIIFYIPKELNIQMDYFYDNDTFTSFYKEINKIEDQELVKNSNFILEKSVELSFNYKEDTKTKILENNFNLFKKNIYKLFNIPNDDIIIFNIQKELNLKISQFYDKKTFIKEL